MGRGNAPNWVNIIFIALIHLSLLALIWVGGDVVWQTWLLAFVWFVLCGNAIGAGYHRYYAHPTHKVAGFWQWYYLTFGAAGWQSPAIEWAYKHRLHHAHTDGDLDPYSPMRYPESKLKGFLWSHILWVFFQTPDREKEKAKRMFQRDHRALTQEKYYPLIAVFFGFLLPALIASLWGQFWLGLLVSGALRLVIQWHATFAVNSLAHMVGRKSEKSSARDGGFFVALATFGEGGYHRHHHDYPNSYKIGIRWHHFDPAKWFIWILRELNFAWDLRV